MSLRCPRSGPKLWFINNTVRSFHLTGRAVAEGKGPELKRLKVGAFSVSTKPNAGTYGAFLITCPFHRKSTVTMCKKFSRLLGNTIQHKRDALMRAYIWAVRHAEFTRQRDHVAIPLVQHPEDFPTLKDVHQRIFPTVAPPYPPKTDEELDAETGECGKSRRRTQAKRLAQTASLNAAGSSPSAQLSAAASRGNAGNASWKSKTKAAGKAKAKAKPQSSKRLPKATPATERTDNGRSSSSS
eukprot:6287863-Amphidinium_carterae.3